MPIAFLLINAEPGSEAELVRELKGIETVKEVHSVYGVYDIVVKVEAETTEKIKDTITWKIRSLEKVRSTLTMIVIE
ncbi:MAG: Lrp/AsnC ligand binding domain-containing protein [Nitrososphaerales archaeon]